MACSGRGDSIPFMVFPATLLAWIRAAPLKPSVRLPVLGCLMSMNSKRAAAVIALIVALTLSAHGRERKLRLRLTDDDRKAIVESVFSDRFDELNAKTSKPNILNDCLHLVLNDETVAFISTNNIERRFVPKIAGVHFEFMTPDEIKKGVKASYRHCLFEFTRFEVAGSAVMVDFSKLLGRAPYFYSEIFRYEFTKVAGKWQRKYIGSVISES